MKKRVTILTAHFGDFSWTEFLVQQIKATIDASRYTVQFLIINQDRTESAKQRIRMFGDVDVLEYPREERFFTAAGHDHPWVLDQGLNQVSGEMLILFDSDAHPIVPDWFKRVEKLLEKYDAVLAEDHVRTGLPHPCFMAFSEKAYQSGISFCDGVLDDAEDTGRRIKHQLEENGFSCKLLGFRKTFCGARGFIYDGMIYHHGSGTFHASNEKRLLDQVHKMDQRIKQIVLDNNRYDFSFGEKWRFKLQKIWGKMSLTSRSL